MNRLLLLTGLLTALAAALKVSPWARRKMGTTTRANVGRWPNDRRKS